MSKDYEVAVYYFPQWHPDPQNEAKRGKGWSEWAVLEKAVPRFPGHQQPKVPLWGYLDESDPRTSQKQIDAAADHGVDVFIYDWYWDFAGTGTGPFLQNALEKGFLHAPNRDRLKFALMWANHREVDRPTWETITDYIIEKYFSQPNYWTIDGGYYFSIYELHTFIKGLGGRQEAIDAIAAFRKKAEAKGYPLHLNLVEWGLQSPEQIGGEPNETAKAFGVDSVTSYVWIHNFVPKAPLYAPYSQWREGALPWWQTLTERFEMPYHPNVSMGWDSSGRFDPNKEYVAEDGYFCTIMSENTPAQFEISLQKVKEFLDQSPMKHKIFTIYAWNEWTEGGYLEPDSINKLGYLEAIKKVFNR